MNNCHLEAKDMLAVAISFASEKHKNQFDKGGMPYILHPLKVMHYLKTTTDFELMCGAVLHDVVEDCDVTFNDLYKIGMSERVMDARRLKGITAKDAARMDKYCKMFYELNLALENIVNK